MYRCSLDSRHSLIGAEIVEGAWTLETTIVSSASLEAGLFALQEGRYSDAITTLEAFCQHCIANAQTNSRDYWRAQMHLVKVYNQQGHPDRSIALCQQLAHCTNAQVQIWAQQHLTAITQSELLPADRSWSDWGNFVMRRLGNLKQFWGQL
ncbi:MAG: hypothetical protein MUF72_03580 [Elainella sp. Prado103]|nr:hypothetical protein [Elainella sp. Prado103]